MGLQWEEGTWQTSLCFFPFLVHVQLFSQFLAPPGCGKGRRELGRESWHHHQLASCLEPGGWVRLALSLLYLGGGCLCSGSPGKAMALLLGGNAHPTAYHAATEASHLLDHPGSWTSVGCLISASCGLCDLVKDLVQDSLGLNCPPLWNKEVTYFFIRPSSC